MIRDRVWVECGKSGEKLENIFEQSSGMGSTNHLALFLILPYPLRAVFVQMSVLVLMRVASSL